MATGYVRTHVTFSGRADDDDVEEDAQLGFLCCHLAHPVGEAHAAERMVGSPGRDRVRHPAGRLH